MILIIFDNECSEKFKFLSKSNTNIKNHKSIQNNKKISIKIIIK